ncbi:MAG: UDP-N-acetylglucosamine 2-epimerase (non-hydrolyzing) [Gemmatimonadota bacterium]
MPDLPTVLVVIGTRPEGIKLAPVIRALRERGGEVSTRVALTGQHSTLMDQVLEVFGLTPEHDLGIMREGQSLYDVAHGTLDGLRDIVQANRTDIILVQGDTASVFFGALVGFFERVPVGHVEAGLRSNDKWQPYPEEIFRRSTSVVADLHFAPTRGAQENLRAEHVPEDQIFLTGNTVVDALKLMYEHPHEPGNAGLKRAIETGKRLVLVTAHRRESFGAPLREAFTAIRDLADRFESVVFLYPVHPNPEVRTAAKEVLADHPRIILTEPMDYLDLVFALKHATFALTDSGGIQEEAPTFRVPVLVMREVTERPEGVAAGVATLVGTDRERIIDEGTKLLTERRTGYAPLSHLSNNPYGDGWAGHRIADIVIHRLTGAPRQYKDWKP